MNVWKGAAWGRVFAHLHAFSQAAKTMCSSLECEPWPGSAGPLVESRDYVLKKKGWGIYPASYLLPSLHILKANTKFTFLH